MLFGRRDFVGRAEKAAAGAEAAIAASGATPRERRHLAALRHWIAGDSDAALGEWEAILFEEPRDLVALKFAQYTTFYRGDSEGMRDSVGRVLDSWDEAVPGYGFVLGCHAFGLEESGDYAAAERAGRRACELNPADVWGAHAVAHVMEMQGRAREGIAWIDSLDPEWDGCNNFVFHIRWHRALFHLERGEHERVLERYDGEFRKSSSEEYLDISNAVAMLWRLEQQGVAVGHRWEELAQRSRERSADHMLVFADLHYVIALAAAGDSEGVEAWLASSRRFAEESEDNQAKVMRAVGLALGEAAVAHRRGDWAAVVERILPVRGLIRRIGGSHAQRDLFEQMLIDAALKAGRASLVRALLSERTHRRPDNVWGWRAAASGAKARGDGAVAAAAKAALQRLGVA